MGGSRPPDVEEATNNIERRNKMCDLLLATYPQLGGAERQLLWGLRLGRPGEPTKAVGWPAIRLRLPCLVPSESAPEFFE